MKNMLPRKLLSNVKRQRRDDMLIEARPVGAQLEKLS